MALPRYTSEDREHMAQTYADGASYARTAEALGCAVNTVVAAVKAAGITPRPSSQIRDQGQPGKWNRRIASNGYVVLYAWVSGENRYVSKLEHREVMAEMVGRPLERHETVHHRNGQRADNRPENLELRIGKHGNGATHCPHCGQAFTP